MRLSPPRTHLKRNRKKAATSKPKISPTNKKHDKLIAKTGALRSRAKVNNIDTEVIHPVIPLTVHDWIKEAIEIMDRPGWTDEGVNGRDLQVVEGNIEVAHELPPGWKYERDNASSLIAGYSRVIKEDCYSYIV